MKNEDGSKRLVAIDLESFKPSFQTTTRDIESDELYALCGLPLISPTELTGFQIEWELEPDPMSQTTWKDQDVTIVPHPRHWFSVLRADLEMYKELEQHQGELIPQPPFLVRGRNGNVLLGCRRFSTDRRKTTH